jgi:hypothetical protein
MYRSLHGIDNVFSGPVWPNEAMIMVPCCFGLVKWQLDEGLKWRISDMAVTMVILYQYRMVMSLERRL